MSAVHRVWVADDEKSIRWVLDKALSKENIEVTCFESAEELLASFAQMQPDVVVSDCLLYTSPSPRDRQKSRMPSSA